MVGLSKQFNDNMLRSVRGAGPEKITVDNIKPVT
jgi:hypothetical protein